MNEDAAQQEFIDTLGDRLSLTDMHKITDVARFSEKPAKSYQTLTTALPVCLDAGAGDAVVKVAKELVGNPNGELAFAVSEQNTTSVYDFLIKNDMVGNEPGVGI